MAFAGPLDMLLEALDDAHPEQGLSTRDRLRSAVLPMMVIVDKKGPWGETKNISRLMRKSWFLRITNKKRFAWPPSYQHSDAKALANQSEVDLSIYLSTYPGSQPWFSKDCLSFLVLCY